MGVKIFDGNGPPHVMIGTELLKRSGISTGMFCMQHGTNPPIKQLLNKGDLYAVCNLCVIQYCDIGASKRATPREPSVSEFSESEGGCWE